jgi:hypothetical protein
VEELAKQEPIMKQAALATCLKLVICLAYSSTLEMKAAYSSETSADL